MEQEHTPTISLISLRTKILVVALLVIVGGGALYYFQSQSKNPQDTQKAAQAEAEALVAVVGKLMVLPTGETPIIATVADPSKLQDQPFFVNAKKGDKVLIYNQAHKAVLYSPIDDRIVEVAPLSIGKATSTP